MRRAALAACPSSTAGSGINDFICAAFDDFEIRPERRIIYGQKLANIVRDSFQIWMVFRKAENVVMYSANVILEKSLRGGVYTDTTSTEAKKDAAQYLVFHIQLFHLLLKTTDFIKRDCNCLTG